MTDEDRTISREELARLSAAAVAPVVRARLHIDGRSPFDVTSRTVVGREPAPEAGTVGIALASDPLVSKTHLAVDVNDGGLVAIDLGSSNGTSIVVAGQTEMLPTTAWTPVPDGAVLVVGDTSLRIELVDLASSGALAPSSMVPPPGTAPAGIVSAVPAAVPPACPQCGRVMVAGARFCDGCGASTVGGPPVAVPLESSQVSSTPASWPVDPVGAPPAPAGASGSPTGDEEASSKRKPLLVGAGIAGVVILAGIAFVMASGGDGSSSPNGGLPAVPSQVDEQWSTDIDGADSVTGDSSGIFVFALNEGDAEVYALAGGSGEERWTSDLANDVSFGYFQGLVDGVLLGETCDFDGACEAFGLDVSDGEVLWTNEQSGYTTVSSAGSVLVNEEGSAELIDPQDGERIERVHGDTVDSDGSYVYVRDGDEVEVFDAKDLSSVFGPVRVDDNAIGAVYQGGRLITGVDDDLVVINADGEVDRESRVPADTIFRMVRGPDGSVIVDTDDGVFRLDPVEDRAEEIWSAEGSLGFAFVSDVGPLVIVAESGDDGSDAEVIDARTGESRVRLRGYYEADQSYGSNGLVNFVYDDGTEAMAYRYADGEEIWSSDFRGTPNLIGGALVEVDDGEVTMYR